MTLVPLGVMRQFLPDTSPAAAASLPVRRFWLWAGYLAATVCLTTAVLRAWSLPLSDKSAQAMLGVFTAATLAAEVFTVDFPDRKRVSGGYIFPLLASAVIHPLAGAWVAGAAGLLSGLLRGQRLRSALFHGPQLALAAAAGAVLAAATPGGVVLELSFAGLVGMLLYMAVYTTTAWGLGWVEELLAGKPQTHASVDLLTNVLLVPLPLALAVIYRQTNVEGLLLSSLSLALLLIVVRAYVNLATLHGELKQAYARLAEQERRLEQALETNREMSQVVSHDLRGPLTSVMGYAELLRNSLARSGAERQLRYVQSIDSNSRRILRLADRLLDLHRLEAGDDVELAPVDVANVVRQVTDELRVRAEQKDLILELDIQPDLPLVSTSEWMLREIAENLLSNAIKYTGDGGHVDLRLKKDRSELRLEVEDDGIGMSAEDRARLFTKFFRGSNEEVQRVRGTGLGLALTRTMVERLGGQVEVWSELGRGSRFTVRLPLTPAAA